MEVSGKLHTLATFTHRREPRYPLNRRLAGLQTQSGHFGEEKNLLILLGFKPRIIQPIA
jgi:hypothetical protein